MKTIKFSIDIKAAKEKVWNILWDDVTYRKWTSVFSPTSYAVSDWKEGSKILFLSENGSGMSSIIDKKIPNEFMSFKHVTEVKNGIELPIINGIEKWSGATENYTLTQNKEFTTLTAEIAISENEFAFFEEIFPKALIIVKNLSEQN